MGTMSYSETMVTNYRPTPHNVPERRKPGLENFYIREDENGGDERTLIMLGKYHEKRPSYRLKIGR